MALLASYTQFLASPTTAILAEDAAINYVPTLTSIHEPNSIIKHLAAQSKVMAKKAEKVLSSLESANSLCVEYESIVEFLSSGGAYLPGLDDNFLCDKTVTFPLIHIVQFDAEQKIRQIRIHWDQASLLKQVDVIGARARNWPIRDGKDQSRLISTSAGVAGVGGGDEGTTTAASRRSTTSRTSEARSHASSVTSATADPHASLALFQPREIAEELTPRKNPSVVAPRASAKPPTRDLTDILTGKEEDDFVPASPSDRRPASPRKNSNGAPKGGAGKNYHPIRLFDENDAAAQVASPDKSVKTHPKKYNHFEFGHGEGAGPAKILSNRAKHASQWDFADFNTPEKPRLKVTAHNVRNFGWSDDEVRAQSSQPEASLSSDQQQDGEKSPVIRPVVHQARPDSQPHFEFVDDGTPATPKQPVVKGRSHNEGLGLYKNNVNEGPDEAATKPKQPLSTVTNVNHDSRHRDFDSQFEMADKSPAPDPRLAAEPPAEKKKPDPNRAKVLKGLNSSWDTYDQSPTAESKKENIYRPRGIKTANNGMGGRKNNDARHWGFGEEDEEEEEGQEQQQQQQQPQKVKKPTAAKTSSGNGEAKSFWDF
jgi:hypothetical protein